MLQLLAIFSVFSLLAFSGLLEQRRVFNFSAGPAALSLPVLLKARRELLSHNGAGAAIFEQSHRDAGGPVQVMIASATRRVKSLLSVPDTHEVLYMHGGAHGQFAALPLNLCREGQVADYVVTGFWSQRAHDEGAKQTRAVTIPGVSGDGTSLVSPAPWRLSNGSCFVHFCASETIDSFEFFSEPDVADKSVPLVGDFTSTILSRRIDVSRYGVIYASGGKNLGPAGFVMVIVRRDLLDRSRPNCPSILNWKAHAETKPIPSIYNSPAVINLWLHELTMEHYENIGGLDVLAKNVDRRKEQVYAEIDGSDFYVMPVNKAHRSAMSVSMTIATKGQRRKDLEQLFVSESTRQGLIQLFGHPVRGGLRVTLYHGVTDEAVDALVVFMRSFRALHQA